MLALGFTLGVAATVATLVMWSRHLARKQPKTKPDNRLAEARRYLTVIQTNVSLSACQRLASKALEVTE